MSFRSSLSKFLFEFGVELKLLTVGKSKFRPPPNEKVGCETIKGGELIDEVDALEAAENIDDE